MASWVASTYDVQVLNVLYDTVTPDNRPRLSIILELEDDVKNFQDGALGNFNRIERKRVQEHLETIASEHGNSRFKIDGLFVIFSAFERVARIEANQKITDREIDRFKLKLGNDDLWTVSRCFDGVTFFFYTDSQLRKYEKTGLIDSYSQAYSQLLRPYDEFGYLENRGVIVSFDSKENFDTNFESNWFYYYR